MILATGIPGSAANHWMPLCQGVGIFLATFILEDAAAIGAGIMVATGSITWPVAFLSCSLGIWFGDAGLYALARFAGRKWFEGSILHKYSAAVTRSEKWFADNGTLILVFSRCVPGARLPTYLAAGFLRWPLPRFALVTGLAVLLWTPILIWLAAFCGRPLLHWFSIYKQSGLMLVAVVLAILAATQVIRRCARKLDQQALFVGLARYRHWEFWPGWFFYQPVIVYCLWLAIKHRGLTQPTVANPGIFAGGLVGESKFATLKDLAATSPDFTAPAEFIPDRNSFPTTIEKDFLAKCFSEEACPDWLGLPFVLKPDLGQRGAGVKIIRSREQAERYFRSTAAPLIAQRYAAGPFEAGIFYYRFPNEKNGRIFSITEKIFPAVTGDGKHTLRELVEANPRARIIADIYFRRFADKLAEVLPVGAEFRLVEAGNHAQGCIFCNGARLITPALLARIDEISKKLNGFFIGRYDVRYASETDLCAGRNFQIVELNGAAAEATAIYDAGNSLWQAYRTLFRQWDMVFAIGAANRRSGAQTIDGWTLWRHWRAYSKLATTYPEAD